MCDNDDDDDDDDRDHIHDVDKIGRGCYMEPTTRINSAPPIISRVCHESRMVAFETGRLLKNEYKKVGPEIFPHVDQQWFDPARDAVHLHYTTWVHPDRGVSVQGNPMCILHTCKRASGQAVLASLTHDFASGGHREDEWSESMALLEDLGLVSVCMKVVCIHVEEGPAIESGVFGRLGEERVVLAEALDHEHIGRFRALWEAHGLCHDPLTEGFFKKYTDDDSTIIDNDETRLQTAREAVEEIQVEWLLSRWHEYGVKMPGLVREEVWEKALAAEPNDGYFFTRQRWVPNPHHPWVKDTYVQTPGFRPTIMFRLCTHKCIEGLAN